MSEDLTGKVAIVTGGGDGIGKRVSERLAQAGASVVIADVNEAGGKAVAASLGDKGAFKRTDVSSQDQIRELMAFTKEKFGRLDILVNNAGIGVERHPTLFEHDFADWHKVMDINVLGVMAATRDGAKLMAETGGGSIVNISSIGGMGASAGNWIYQLSKSCVALFSKSAALELGPYGVRVNCIAPGNIETDILARNFAGDLTGAAREERMNKLRSFLINRQPIQRQGVTDDIAEAILYYVSDRSSYVTGTLLPVDGGQVAGPFNPPGSNSLKSIMGEE